MRGSNHTLVVAEAAGLPLTAAIEQVATVQASHPLLVLALYAAIATAVCFVRALRRPRPAPAEAHAGPELQPVAQ